MCDNQGSFKDSINHLKLNQLKINGEGNEW